MNIAIGWACTLNDIFVRFPYEKYKSLMTKYNTFIKRRSLIKNVFKECVYLVIKDIIDNNVTFKVPSNGYLKGEIHAESIRGEQFIDIKKKGGFKGVDFLESIFTGNFLYLYLSGKRDNFLARRKFRIIVNKDLRDLLAKHTNEGKQYA